MIEGSVGEYLAHLVPGLTARDDLPNWPPDVFAIAGSLLQRSSTYPRVLSGRWPPPGHGTLNQWRDRVFQLGWQWRDNWNRSGSFCRPPEELTREWSAVVREWNTSLDEIDEAASLAMLNLLAVADEACEFIGFPTAHGSRPELYSKDAMLALQTGRWASLGRRVHGSKVSVLPKSHTPQTGFTIRSLSHNLALCLSSEMRPVWRAIPVQLVPRSRRLNLLLVPWPRRIEATAFRPVDLAWHEIARTRYGYFTYEPPLGEEGRPAQLVRDLLERVGSHGDSVDGVVFPELSLTKTEYNDVLATIAPKQAGEPAVRFLLAGALESTKDGELGKNQLRFDLIQNDGRGVDRFVQSKHHRWQINESQMTRYGLTEEFSRERLYWESIEIRYRDLNILALDPFLTMTVLICEDLARPDPVGDLTRAVAPNLIVALLADAPQLKSRWPGRYAGSLADDPGSSVLTLTSLGMCQLDRYSKPEAKRTVGLWWQGGGKSEELILPEECDGLLLTLEVGQREEFSADGRSDRGNAGDVKFVSCRGI